MQQGPTPTSFTQALINDQPTKNFIDSHNRSIQFNSLYLAPPSGGKSFRAEGVYYYHYQGGPHYTNNPEILKNHPTFDQVKQYFKKHFKTDLFSSDRCQPIPVLLDFAPLAVKTEKEFNQAFNKMLKDAFGQIDVSKIEEFYHLSNLKTVFDTPGLARIRSILRAVRDLHKAEVFLIIDNIDKPFLTLDQKSCEKLNKELAYLSKNHNEIDTLLMFGVHDCRCSSGGSSSFNATVLHRHYEWGGLGKPNLAPAIGPLSLHLPIIDKFLAHELVLDAVKKLITGESIQERADRINISLYESDLEDADFSKRWLLNYLLELNLVDLQIEESNDDILPTCYFAAVTPQQKEVLSAIVQNFELNLQTTKLAITPQREMQADQEKAKEQETPQEQETPLTMRQQAMFKSMLVL